MLHIENDIIYVLNNDMESIEYVWLNDMQFQQTNMINVIMIIKGPDNPT